MLELLSSEIFWQTLGFTVASGIMISPIYYNGDYGKPLRAAVVLGVCGFFSLMLFATGEYINWTEWAVLSGLINFCFVLGLYLGVYLYNLNISTKKGLICHNNK